MLCAFAFETNVSCLEADIILLDSLSSHLIFAFSSFLCFVSSSISHPLMFFSLVCHLKASYLLRLLPHSLIHFPAHISRLFQNNALVCSVLC